MKPPNAWCICCKLNVFWHPWCVDQPSDPWGICGMLSNLQIEHNLSFTNINPGGGIRSHPPTPGFISVNDGLCSVWGFIIVDVPHAVWLDFLSTSSNISLLLSWETHETWCWKILSRELIQHFEKSIWLWLVSSPNSNNDLSVFSADKQDLKHRRVCFKC